MHVMLCRFERDSDRLQQGSILMYQSVGAEKCYSVSRTPPHDPGNLNLPVAVIALLHAAAAVAGATSQAAAAADADAATAAALVVAAAAAAAAAAAGEPDAADAPAAEAAPAGAAVVAAAAAVDAAIGQSAAAVEDLDLMMHQTEGYTAVAVQLFVTEAGSGSQVRMLIPGCH